MRLSVLTLVAALAAAWTLLGQSAAPCAAQMPNACPAAGPCTDQGCCQEPADSLTSFFDPDPCGPRWTFTADGIALQRSTTRNQPLFTNRAGTTALPSINSQTLDFPVTVGPQLSAVRHGDGGWDVEIAYFQFDGFDTQQSVPGTSLMVTDSTGSGFSVVDAEARYKSALYSGELNVRRQWTDWLNVMAGFRMLELDEHYLADGTGTQTPVADFLRVNAYNHLWGLQVGADVEFYNMGGPLTVKALCKAGVYGNSADQNIRRVDTGFIDQSMSATGSKATFLGEAAVVATYAVTPRLAFRASAQAMWLEGVALAPEQIGASDFQSQTVVVDTAGGVFYYGGGLGLEYRF